MDRKLIRQDDLAADLDTAAQTICALLPAGAEMAPSELVPAVEKRHPQLKRDHIRGAIWQLLNGHYLVATDHGTIQRLSEVERDEILAGFE